MTRILTKVLTGLCLAALAAFTTACATTPPPAGLPDPADLPQCPASLRQEPLPQPRLPDGATIPRPVDAADAAGLEATLDHMAAVAAWGRAGWARADAARVWCAGWGRSPPS